MVINTQALVGKPCLSSSATFSSPDGRLSGPKKEKFQGTLFYHESRRSPAVNHNRRRDAALNGGLD
jgi:hypothetical protein